MRTDAGAIGRTIVVAVDRGQGAGAPERQLSIAAAGRGTTTLLGGAIEAVTLAVPAGTCVTSVRLLGAT